MRCSALLLALMVHSSRGQIDDEPDMGAGVGGGDGGVGGGALATPTPTCSFSTKGIKFDLTGMKRDDHDYTGTTPGGYTYRFNVCAGTVKVCNSQNAPASKWRGTKCNNLGDQGTQSIALLDEKSPYKGLKVTYKDGDICKKQVTTRRAARATCRCVLLRMCAVLPWCCRMAGAAASARHCRR